MAKLLVPVPLYKQPVDKPWCGPTAAKMVLEYHGKHISIQEIARRTHASNGIWMPTLGTFLMRIGFKVMLYEWDTTFPSRFIDLSDSKIRDEITAWSRRRDIKHRENRQYRFALRRYLQNGGGFNVKVYEGFSINKLQTAINRSGPPIINVMAAPLWGEWERVKTVEHCVVLTRIDGKKSVIHDPAYGKIELPTELLRFVCYNADQVSIMYISKK